MADRIVICDNSGFDYSEIEEIKQKATEQKKTIEFLNFHGDSDKILKLGKGYGEGEIMEYVLLNSKLIKPDEISFCKVTGRILILNIDAILKNTFLNENYFQRMHINPFAAEERVDTRFYQCTLKTFKDYLFEAYQLVNDNEGNYLEHVYHDQLKVYNVDYRSFNKLPRIEGVSGSTGETYRIRAVRWFLLKNIYVVLNFIATGSKQK
jgi:hypothetical protein